MVDNGEDWMEPLLEIQRELASHKDPEIKKEQNVSDVEDDITQRTGH